MRSKYKNISKILFLILTIADNFISESLSFDEININNEKLDNGFF